MTYVRPDDEIGFDVQKASDCLSAYVKATGMECVLINTQGDTILSSDPQNKQCSFCQKVEDAMPGCVDCKHVHLYGSYQAERIGGKYIFFCPLGLVHWASPITIDGEMKGSLLGGPVLMMEAEEFLLEDILVKQEMDEKCLEDLRESTRKIPVVETDKVNSFSEILFMVSAFISHDAEGRLTEKQHSLKQQAGISEYIHTIKENLESQGDIKTYPLEKEKELLSYISIGDRPNAQRVLNDILGHVFFTTGGSLKVMKARVLELAVLLSRAALEGGADDAQVFGLNYNYLNEISAIDSVENLTIWLSRIMNRFTDFVFNFSDIKHVDVIYKAVKYIKQNYMNKVSLEEVAAHVFLSPSYFSKVFKDEMKCNFNTYLNDLRIKMSKGLLLDNSISLVDISSLVGFEDQSYFSKMFKKLVGMSPGKYRESRGKTTGRAEGGLK